ncbi:MAG: ABC transporter ATP-binding protein [Clostridia bacterium]|nr:ABC transporter ATP-binding protein [Clostridia bacterium]
MLKLQNITKSYAQNNVLKGINLELTDGQVYGLVGSNGAGKTTLLNIIAGVLSKNSGTVEIDNLKVNSVNDIKGKIGYVLDIPAMYEYLTAQEYLMFLLSATNFTNEEKQNKIENLLIAVGLNDVKNKLISNFSRGMKQRLGIASGLISNPKIILMDEPSSALDPQGRAEVLYIIEQLKAQGKTILLSTHILNDVERICDKVGLLVNGVIAVEGSLNEIIEKYSKPILKIDCVEVEKLKELVENIDGCISCVATANSLEVTILPEKKKEIMQEILNLDIDINGIYTKRASLEEIFLNVKQGGAI